MRPTLRATGSSEVPTCAICGAEHPLADMVTGHIEPEDIPADARRAAPEPRDWWLADGEALHAESPRSYFIPTRARREALRPGELVKLEFQYGPHADREGEGHVERMWVEVHDATHGALRNQPFRLAELELGDRVDFEPQHVITIDYTDEELGYEQDQWVVLDSRVFEEDRPPERLAFAHGLWFMLLGGHGFAEPERIIRVTDAFPALEGPVRAGEGVWERDGDGYRRVDETAGDWPQFLADVDALFAAMQPAEE